MEENYLRSRIIDDISEVDLLIDILKQLNLDFNDWKKNKLYTNQEKLLLVMKNLNVIKIILEKINHQLNIELSKLPKFRIRSRTEILKDVLNNPSPSLHSFTLQGTMDMIKSHDENRDKEELEKIINDNSLIDSFHIFKKSLNEFYENLKKQRDISNLDCDYDRFYCSNKYEIDSKFFESIKSWDEFYIKLWFVDENLRYNLNSFLKKHSIISSSI